MFLRSLVFAVQLMVGLALCGSSYAAPVSTVTVDKKGTSVTVEGIVSGWKPSWSASSPNSFYVGDQSGTIRVCIWPDVMAKLSPATAAPLSSGAAKNLEVSGIIKDFRGAPELHVKDAADVKLKAAPAPAAVSVPVSVPGAPAPVAR